MFQRFRFAYPGKRVTHDRLNQIENLESNPLIGLHPKSEVFAKFRLKNTGPILYFSQSPPRPANRLVIGAAWFVVVRGSMPSTSVPH